MDIPSSQVIPMTACPGLRPRWCSDYSPYRNQCCRLPSSAQRRLSLPVSRKLSYDHNEQDFGAHTQPAASFSPAPDSRYRVYPRTSLLTCWLDFSQVGLFRNATGSTHWITLSNFIPSQRESQRSGFSLARSDFLPISPAPCRIAGIVISIKFYATNSYLL